MPTPDDFPRDEFLHFLTDLLDQGTGELRLDRLAHTLNLRADQEAHLADAMVKTGGRGIEPALLLDLLEAAYDRLGSLQSTIDWFMHEPQAAYESKTPFEVCTSGGLEPLRRAQRQMLMAKSKSESL